jgi:putative tryptophan/tyrosine transport system substrate-binding protein
MRSKIGSVHSARRHTGGRYEATALALSTLGVLVILALGVLVIPLASDAQRAGKGTRIGLLTAGTPRSAVYWVAFEQRLRDLGHVEGHHLEIAFCNAEGIAEKFVACADELVHFQPDVIVAAGPEASIRAVQHATNTLPIVMLAVDYDPVALGYVASLARPGGHITGVVFQQVELAAKRLELLKEALPTASRVGVFSDPFTADQLRAVATAAQVLGVHLQPLELQNPPYDYESAFSVAVQGHADALVVLMSPVLGRDRARLIDLAAQHRLPLMMSGDREWAKAGAFMAYGVNMVDMWRRAADYIDKILKGTKPADLPVEQPMRFELGINLKTAKALGITFPPALLVLADEVIR